MLPNLEPLLHIAELLGYVFGAVAVIVKIGRPLTRLADILQDYPPHRHVNGHTIYPREFHNFEAERH